jgi:PAS domain S-box-containing protein
MSGITEKESGGPRGGLVGDETALRLIIDRVPIGVAIHDREGRIEYINSRFSETFGYSLADIPDKAAWAAAAAPDPAERAAMMDRWSESLRKARETGGGIPATEFRLRCKDGSFRDALVSGLLYDGRAFVIFEDVTERLKRESALRESEESLSRVLEQAPIAMAVHDLAGNIEFINAKFKAAFGYSPGDIPTLDAWTRRAYPDPAYRAGLLKMWGEWVKDSMQTGREMPGGEYSVRCRDGSFRNVFITGIVTKSNKVVSILEDVTERAEVQRSLRESESLYRALVETTRTGYVVLDMDGRVRDANREYVRLSGHSDLKQIMGRSVVEWSAPHNKKEAWEAVLLAVREGKVVNFELDYSGPSGELIPIEINATLVTRGGQPRILGLCRDITDRRRARSEIVALNRDLEKKVEARTAELLHAQKMEVVGRLAGGISHDFNNILAAISGSAELLLLDLPGDSPARGALSDIVRETERGKALTGQLGALGRKQPFSRERFALNGAVESSCRMLGRLTGRGVKLETRLAPDAGEIEADPGQISQLIMNLVINASDAIEGAGTIKVSTRAAELEEGRAGMQLAAPAGRYAVLSVSDTGHGISAENMARLFEPFFTTKPEGKGTGLGLPIVYGIADRLGGGIEVESVHGRGSEFRVYFPAG